MARLIKTVMTENGEAQIDYTALANLPDLNNEMFRKLGVNPLTKVIGENAEDTPANWNQVGTGCGVITAASGNGDIAKITNYPWGAGDSQSAWLFNLCYRPNTGEYGIIQILYAYDGNTGKKHNIYRRRGNVDDWYDEGWVKDFDSKDLIPLANGGTNCDLSEADDYAIIRKGGPAANNSLRSVSTKSGALYATGDNKEPKFGTLPIGQGGTGADNKRDATLNINYLANDPLCDYIKNKTGKNATNKDDVPLNWVEIGPGYTYINGGKDDSGKCEAGDAAIITDYPDEAGDAFLINLVPRSTTTNFVRQILLPYNGHIYTRYGSNKTDPENTFTPWYRELRNNGTQTIDGGSLVVNRESTGAGVTVNAPLETADKKTVNIQSVLGPGHGTINGNPAPRTSIVHHEDDKEANRMSLYNDRTIFGQPVTISSGGTGATTKADALSNLGAMPKANFKLEGTTLTITL